MEADIRSSFVKAGNINAHYLVAGEGAPVILVHGGGNDAREWASNIGPLSGHYHVYAPDLPGFGGSDKPRLSYSIGYFVSFLSQFVEALGLERVSLAGVSLGGGIALGFTLDFPKRVEKLVLIDSACIDRRLPILWRLNTFLIMSLPARIRIFLMKSSKHRIKSGLRRAFYDHELITDELIEQMYQVQSIPEAQVPQLSMGKNLVGLRGQRIVFRDRLPEIKTPTLIIWGAQDKIMRVAHAHSAHKLISRSKLHIFDHCGHAPQREKAEEFNRLVIDFLANG